MVGGWPGAGMGPLSGRHGGAPCAGIGVEPGGRGWRRWRGVRRRDRRRGRRHGRVRERGFGAKRDGAREGGFLAAAQDGGGVVLVGVAECVVGGQGQVAGAGVAVRGLFGHAAGDHRVEALGNARTQHRRLRNRIHQVRGDQDTGTVCPVGRGSGEAFVEHAGQGVDVGAVGDFVVGKPFRRHVFPGAHRGAQLGELFVGGGAGDAEVDQIGEVVAGDENVLRFDVAVHHPGGMRGIERRGDLGDDGHRARRGQRAKAFEHAV